MRHHDSIRDVAVQFGERIRTPNARTVRGRSGSRSAAQPNRTPRFEPGSNAERRNPSTCHISHIIRLFIRIITIYRYLYNILVICSGYYIDVIQIHRFASIDSHALTAAPPGRKAPESPSARTLTEIFGIFPFWAAYITNFYVFPAGQATRQISVRTPYRTEPNFDISS